MARSSERLAKANSIWYRAIVVIWMIKIVRMAGSTNKGDSIIRRNIERNKFIDSIETMDYPLINPSIDTTKLFLKHLREIVVLTDLKKTKACRTCTSNLGIQSLILCEDSIYLSNPVISIQTDNLIRKIKSFKDTHRTHASEDSIYNIMLNHPKTETARKSPLVYKNPWIYSIFRRCEEKSNSSCAFLKQMVYYFYRREVKKSNSDFNAAKKSFIAQLEKVRLTMDDFNEIGLDKELIKAINNEISQEDRSNLHEQMIKGLDTLDTALQRVQAIFNDELFTDIETKPPYYFTYLINVISKIKIKRSDIFLSKFDFIDLDFYMLKDAFIGYNPNHVLKYYRNKKNKPVDERWENPIFMRSIIYMNKVCIAIEFKEDKENEKNEMETVESFKIVAFTDENIRAIEEARSIGDIDKIKEIDPFRFSIDMIYENLSAGMEVVKVISKSLCPEHKLST